MSAKHIPILLNVLLAFGSSYANAEDTPSITVTGVGKIMILPDTVELEGTIQGTGTLAGDAVTTFSDIKQEATLAIQEISAEDLQVSSFGFSVGSALDPNSSRMIMLAARGEQPPEAEVAVRETMKIRISGVDEMDQEKLVATVAKIIDAGKESGLTFAKPATLYERTVSRGDPISYLSFQRSDLQQLQQQADELAMKKARSQAERISRLAGLSVGTIISIEELRLSSAVTSLRRGDPDTRPQLQRIKIEKQLRVKFALVAGNS